MTDGSAILTQDGSAEIINKLFFLYEGIMHMIEGTYMYIHRIKKHMHTHSQFQSKLSQKTLHAPAFDEQIP